MVFLDCSGIFISGHPILLYLAIVLFSRSHYELLISYYSPRLLIINPSTDWVAKRERKYRIHLKFASLGIQSLWFKFIYLNPAHHEYLLGGMVTLIPGANKIAKLSLLRRNLDWDWSPTVWKMCQRCGWDIYGLCGMCLALTPLPHAFYTSVRMSPWTYTRHSVVVDIILMQNTEIGTHNDHLPSPKASSPHRFCRVVVLPVLLLRVK